LAVADLNNDNFMDIAVALDGSNYLNVFLVMVMELFNKP
jgi:hypothetical protein